MVLIEDDSTMAENTTKKKKNSGGFQSMGLSEPIFRGIQKMGFRVPTPVQRKSLPVCLSGANVCVMARTGSGKTAAFVIPILEKLLSSRSHNLLGQTSMISNTNSSSSSSIGAVILSPTRELSLQTLRVIKTLGQYCTNIKAVGIIGGDSMEKQFEALASKPDILVATPGRLAHHLSEIPDFSLKNCELFVLDEADRLFEMGFSHQIREICRSLPKEELSCQKMLFSATMPKALVEFTRESTGLGLIDPVVIRLDNEVKVSDDLRIGFFTCRTEEKDALLLYLVRDLLMERDKGIGRKSPRVSMANDKNIKKKKKGENKINKHEHLTLIFCATRHHVEYVTTLLQTAHIPATMIYGTMDLEARKNSLQRFRSGESPVLVVTDVAARGIDVPLIENVVHHSFPPSPKLFIHRSGRAARAGRIGFCFALVDPDEMPYMVDLHLFLGRKLSTAEGAKVDDNNNKVDNDEANDDVVEKSEDLTEATQISAYNLDQMTPDMVHYGSVPEWILTEQVEEMYRIIQRGENMVNLKRVCQNAMKQYRKSRPDASKSAMRRSKHILDQFLAQNFHPIFRYVEQERIKGEGKEKAEDIMKRQEFLKAMANFRPKETVFEAFSSGSGSTGNIVSQVDKGRTTSKDTTAFNANALRVMKSMRRQMKLARNKGASMVVAGSNSAKILNGEEVIDENEVGTDGETSESIANNNVQEDEAELTVKVASKVRTEVVQPKKYLSKAERKRQKKNKNKNQSSTGAGQEKTSVSEPQNSNNNKNSNKRSTNSNDYRDHDHYIDMSRTNSRDKQMESMLQPSSSTSAKDPKAQALRMEEAMLDIVGDENADMVKKHRMMRWDKSKRKYVQSTIGEELSGGNKKLRTESGALVKSDKAKLGELYEKWQKKTQKSIGRSGVFDDMDEDDNNNNSSENNQILKMQKRAASKNKKNNGRGGKDGVDGLKSAVQIRKEREAKEKNKVKNMSKSNRKSYLGKGGKGSGAATKKGYQGKKGFSGNWGAKSR